tara:strand:- start:5205 stop:5717 length:513 start_codon:yes stop_codon:yes gene_type:complete
MSSAPTFDAYDCFTCECRRLLLVKEYNRTIIKCPICIHITKREDLTDKNLYDSNKLYLKYLLDKEDLENNIFTEYQKKLFMIEVELRKNNYIMKKYRNEESEIKSKISKVILEIEKLEKVQLDLKNKIDLEKKIVITKRPIEEHAISSPEVKRINDMSETQERYIKKSKK